MKIFLLCNTISFFILAGCNINAMQARKTPVRTALSQTTTQITTPEEIYSIGKNSEKIDTMGKYIIFPGVTIVADTSATDQAFFEEIYAGLQRIPHLKEYYSLLPVDSYHMTTNNLYVKNHARSWKEFEKEFKAGLFKKIHETLQKDPIVPEVKLVSIKAERTMAIILNAEKDQQDKIVNFGNKFKIEKFIPKPFHITLGYLYKDIPVSQQIIIREKAGELFNNLLVKYYSDKLDHVFVLRPTSLRYFNTMLEFYAWDGQNKPF